MKNLIIISGILIITVSTFAFGNPPKAVKDSFKQKFPAVEKVKWAKENNGEWEANFSLNDIKASANFSQDGMWLESETEIPAAQLPEKVISSINESYSGYVIVGAAKIENNKNEIFYEADIKSGKKKKEVLYKEDGTFIK